MRAIVKVGPVRGVELRSQVAEPEAGPGEVVIKVAASSICGTDLHLFEWDKSAQAFNPTLPLIMGHEFAGTVVATGSGVTQLKKGDRVAAESHIFCGHCYFCRTGDAHNCLNMRLLGLTWDGAFAEYAKLPVNVCFALPDAIPLEIGALFEGCGVAVHGFQRAGSVAGAAVVVMGCGPIGLVLIALCQAFGATSVIGVEPNPYRRKLVEKLGARAVDPRSEDVVKIARDMNPRRGGADVGFEVSAARGVMRPLFDALRREATLVTIGHPSESDPIDIAADINKKGVTLKGIFGRRIWDTWELLLALIESKRLDLSWLITHRFDLAEFDQGIALLTGEAGKVLIMPN